ELIISDMLDYTRAGELRREPVALDPWLRDLLEEQTLPAGVSLRRDLAAPVTAFADPHRLRRVVINLVENAAQAMTDPTGRAIVVADACITVASRVSGDRIEISVKDNGPGIPAEVLPRIFEPLFSTKGFGVGLGLPTVKQIIEHHG